MDEKSKELPRISWTAGNVYDKLDKATFMLITPEVYPNRGFVDAKGLIRERNPRKTDFTDEETQKSYEEFMKRMDELGL